jgi:DNA-binding NtrC family response regulator
MSRILLVDDDDSVRKALRPALERMGHQVIEARDGNEALKSCQGETLDLVLTDLVMPDKEGLETIVDIKKKYPALPVIAMSGGGRNSPQSYLDLATRLGAASVLAKPFSLQEMATAIDAALK